MTRSQAVRRSVVRTVLVVCEGNSEVLFVKHIASLYLQRGSGVRVTVKNARGKGAAHVIDVAIRQSRNADYDERAVLLDTDVGWNQTTEKLARQSGVRVFASTPCLEALLLQVHQKPFSNRSSAQLKAAFSEQFGRPASDPLVFAEHFGLPHLAHARPRIGVLNQLVTLLEKGAISP